MWISRPILIVYGRNCYAHLTGKAEAQTVKYLVHLTCSLCDFHSALLCLIPAVLAIPPQRAAGHDLECGQFRVPSPLWAAGPSSSHISPVPTQGCREAACSPICSYPWMLAHNLPMGHCLPGKGTSLERTQGGEGQRQASLQSSFLLLMEAHCLPEKTGQRRDCHFHPV